MKKYFSWSQCQTNQKQSTKLDWYVKGTFIVSVEDLVKEFLDGNPHFKSAGPATTQTKSNVSQSREKLDITKLNMSSAADRKIYAEYRKANGIA